MRRVVIAATATAAAIAIVAVAWRLRDTSHGLPAVTASPTVSAPIVRGERRPDPKTIARGSIAGTITSDGRPLAGAQVCAAGRSHHLAGDVLREPTCTTSDASGRYKLAGLLPARYEVSASAPTFQPAAYLRDPRRGLGGLDLGRGGHRIGVDLDLREGGVEVTGLVSDLTGRPIAGARVTAAPWLAAPTGVFARTDAAGRFAVWVAPGHVVIDAGADGYTDNLVDGRAPGTLDVTLTPASTLSGIVVDAASGRPVEGARITTSVADDVRGGDSTFSDAAGAFRISRLEPGSHAVFARTSNGYGRSEGSIRAELGRHVDGVIVKLYPAVRVTGKIVVASNQQTCRDGASVALRDERLDRWVTMRAEPDGLLWADGVLPGEYRVNVVCAGYASRHRYPPVTIATAPVDDLVWPVDAGTTLRGKVLVRGRPVAGALVYAIGVGHSAHGSARTDRDGTYEITGLFPGAFALEVSTDDGLAPRDGFEVELVANGTSKDLVLEEAGSIAGLVVDDAGRGVEGISVTARGSDVVNDALTDAAGAFTIASVRPGVYRVIARRGAIDEQRKPGTTDDARPGERVIVRAGSPVRVRLVVEALVGVIEGMVVDASGNAVTDAFVTAARESDAAGASGSSVVQSRWADDQAVVTAVDGVFAIGRLAPGKYTVRAQRRGGAEVVAEHVEVGTTVRLRLPEAGAVAGTVVLRSGARPVEVMMVLHDTKTGWARREVFYRTGGAFVLRDLPPGTFHLTAVADGAQAQRELALAAGETTNVEITVDAPVAVTGRVVEVGTRQPVAGIVMIAMLARGDGRPIFGGDDDRAHITDGSGRFTISRVPVGSIVLRGWPDDASEHHGLSAFRTIAGTGTIDVGDVPIVKRRAQPGVPVGRLGINFAEQPRDTPPARREHRVSFIDPAGPAAKTALKVGDVVIAIDGVDITGSSSGLASPLMRAPAGTELALGLARGVTIRVVLVPP